MAIINDEISRTTNERELGKVHVEFELTQDVNDKKRMMLVT